MRPSRIVLGECRGEEAYDLLLALGSGHAGSLGTLHANGARQALRRLEALALLGAGSGAPVTVLREWIAECLHAVVFVSGGADGRKVREIVELRGIEAGVLRFAPLYGGGPALRSFACNSGTSMRNSDPLRSTIGKAPRPAVEDSEER